MAQNKHLQFIRSLSCAICGDNTSTEAAHLRFGDMRVGKTEAGIGRRDDRFVNPLCGQHHRAQHAAGEFFFWDRQPVDPIILAAGLYINSGDYETCEKILSYWRQQ